MNSEHVLGWIAFAVTIVYTALGLPVQIRRNAVNRSMTGLSLFMTSALLCTFSSWVAYGLVKNPRDWYIVASNLPGVIGAAALMFQFWKYRKK